MLILMNANHYASIQSYESCQSVAYVECGELKSPHFEGICLVYSF